MRLLWRARRLVLVTLMVSAVAVGPGQADRVYGQQVPQVICGAEGTEAPIGIGQPGAEGWTHEQEALATLFDVRRYRFTVASKGTAYVYVGDQWYNLNLGLFSLKTGTEACWTVEVRGTSTESERRVMQFVRPDERAIEVEEGDYILTVRAGDPVGFDPARKFTVRVAVGPRVCALSPPNVPVPEYPGMTQKPDNPDKFQIGLSFQPEEAELGPFTLMSFNAYVSPPYTDLFDFTWELDGEVVPGVTEPTVMKPYAELPKTPTGQHAVRLTVRGAREYKDPTDPQFNFTPFDGGSRTVTCTFQGG